MTTLKKFSDTVLQEIDKRKVSKVPRWYFVFKNILFWSAFCIALVLGSFSFAVIFFAFLGDIDVYAHLPVSRISFFFQSLPFFWLAFLGVFLWLSIVFFRTTKKGYQISISFIFAIVFGVSIVGGGIIHAFGGGERFEQIFTTPFYGVYRPLEERRMERWMNPKEGLLAGKVVETGSEYWTIADFRRNIWRVDVTNAVFFPEDIIDAAEHVRIVGSSEKKGLFTAERVMYWNPHKKHEKRKKHRERM